MHKAVVVLETGHPNGKMVMCMLLQVTKPPDALCSDFLDAISVLSLNEQIQVNQLLYIVKQTPVTIFREIETTSHNLYNLQ